MPTDAIAAIGTLLKIGDGGTPESFTTIAEVKDISGPEFSATKHDVTPHNAASAMAEIIVAKKAAGDITFKINFVTTGATHSYASGLLLDWHNKTRRNWQLVWPDTGTYTLSFAGFVTGFKTSEPVDGPLEADVTISITGAVTFTP